ncbi:TIGR03087 family PEP-CTERM/XrtA system glycosyltransferase [Tsuneonella sp. HG222]
MTREILFLAHRLPFPPDRGDKIRSHHILKALAELAPVHVGCFGETEADLANEHLLAQVAASHCMPMRTKPLVAAGIEALLSDEPVSVTAFRHPALQAWVERTLAERPIDTIYVFSGQMGQYVPPDWTERLVVDLVDVDSAKFESYAAAKRWPLGWIDRREGRLLQVMEGRLARIADRTLLVSEAEADLLKSRLTYPQSAHVSALGNGIDASAFDPAAWHPADQFAAAPGPHIVFTGQMDYAPNVTAVTRMAGAVLPEVLRQHPDAHFHIVGRAPTADVRALAGRDVTVWGEVAAVQPFLISADLVVAPLAIARGVQNKVLEAMAMGCTVLLTPEAATGIDAVDGFHFAIAADDSALARRALALLADRPRARAMGNEARRYVVERMSWTAMLSKLPAIVGHRAPDVRRDAA